MLQFPTNVYPQNVAFDANNQQSLTCVFNGDILTSVWYKAYDYYSGSLVSTSYRKSGQGARQAIGYNGDGGGIALTTSSFENGNDYVIQLMYTQSTADGADNIYDMPIVRGNILSASGTSIMIADKIQNIYEWNVSNNVCSPSMIDDVVYAGAVIKVGAETRFINSYNRSTGQLIVDSAFTGSIANKSYTILANYLVTPQYYFMCRETPTLSVSKTMIRQSTPLPPEIKVTGTYGQSDGSMIKYYTMSLYCNDKLIKKSPKIYSQKIQYLFFSQFINQGNETVTYKAVCDVVTQEGESVSAYITFTITADNELVVCENMTATCVNEFTQDYLPLPSPLSPKKIHQSVVIEYAETSTGSMDEAPADLYRKDLETGIETHLYAASVNHKIVDWSVPNKGNFEYILLPRNRDTGVPYVASKLTKRISTNFVGYSITELKPIGVTGSAYYEGDEHYYKGESWEFCGSIDDSTITQNLDRIVQAGHNRYTTMSSGESNYLSGTLTADIGYLECSDRKFKDTIDMVKAWRDFISRDTIYLLKTQKGDVLIVNITDNPTTTYAENMSEIPTTISFDWTECESIDNVVLRIGVGT